MKDNYYFNYHDKSINVPENVDDKKILTSDGNFGGSVVYLPCNMSSYRRIADLISGSAARLNIPLSIYFLHEIKNSNNAYQHSVARHQNLRK